MRSSPQAGKAADLYQHEAIPRFPETTMVASRVVEQFTGLRVGPILPLGDS
jgi:hypothetical protein